MSKPNIDFLCRSKKETGTETVGICPWNTGSFRRIQASAVGKLQRAAKIKGKKAEKGKIRHKEEELTPPYSFGHHRHPEYMTHYFFHCITAVGGLTWFLPCLLLIYHLPPTFKIQNCQNSDFLSWQHYLVPPSCQSECVGVTRVCFDPEPDLKTFAKALFKLWTHPEVKQVLQHCSVIPSQMCIKICSTFLQNKTKLVRQVQAWFHSFISFFIHT